MKIARVEVNNQRRCFSVRVGRRSLDFPFARAEPRPSRRDPVVRAYVDQELAREAFSFVLASGKEGTVHVEQLLEYHQDPGLLRERLLHLLTVEAGRRVAASPLSKREITRRLGTSASQFYRLLDPTNSRKSVDQLLGLLHVLDCDVRVIVRRKSA
jgi:hypothetical protein